MTAELIDRVRRGQATAAEVEQLDAWRRVSPDNEREFSEMTRLLDAGRSLAVVGGVGNRLTTAEVILRTRRRERRWLPWAVAAAAVLVAGASIASRFRSAEPASVAGWAQTEVVTGATELATVQLGEGSVVRLAPSS